MNKLKPDVIILGSGGHAKVIIEILQATGWEPVGLLDPAPRQDSVLGIRVLGGDEISETLFGKGYRNAFIAIGGNSLRRTLAYRMRQIGFHLVTAVHPSAVISPSATLGDGVAVMPHAVINADARVGNYAIVNTGAIVEHDCLLGEAVHAGPRSVVGGHVILEDEVLLGIGAVVRPCIRIGRQTVIGAGAVVIDQIPPERTVVGVPARPLIRED